MNDHQKEAAARELCRLRGVDPEERISSGVISTRAGVPVPIYSKAWELAFVEIAEQEQLEMAMAHGRKA